MSGKIKRKLSQYAPLAIATILALIFLVPLYVCIIYALKSKQEITFTGLAFPTSFHFDNFTRAMEACHFWRALFNSFMTTWPTVLVLTVVCPMAAYVLGRNKTKMYAFIYAFLLMGLYIPYQTVLLPLYSNLKTFHLLNTYTGNVIVKTGFQISTTILMLTGFINNVPRDIEEAAYIDGLSRGKTFWRIVFPLLRPVMISSVIINTLFSWNDFQLSLVTLTKDKYQTLPQALYSFFGKHSAELNLAFAAFTLAMIPLIVLYLFFQKYITDGIMSGSVKG